MRFQSILLLSLILTSISEEMNETKKNETEDLNNPFKLTEKEEEQLKYDESIGKDTSNWDDSPEYKEKMREEAEQQLLSNITFYLNEMGLSNATLINKEQFRILFKKLFGNPGKKSEENLEEKTEEKKEEKVEEKVEEKKEEKSEEKKEKLIEEVENKEKEEEKSNDNITEDVYMDIFMDKILEKIMVDVPEEVPVKEISKYFNPEKMVEAFQEIFGGLFNQGGINDDEILNQNIEEKLEEKEEKTEEKEEKKDDKEKGDL